MSASATLQFGGFELNPAAGELRHRGDLVKLAPQRLKVLELMARRGGEIITRAEIREHVSCGDTFVDFEQGLNFCIRQIREERLRGRPTAGLRIESGRPAATTSRPD
jgi:DNA-binding winged helix-turn-helix (wHTH) protein